MSGERRQEGPSVTLPASPPAPGSRQGVAAWGEGGGPRVPVGPAASSGNPGPPSSYDFSSVLGTGAPRQAVWSINGGHEGAHLLVTLYQ